MEGWIKTYRKMVDWEWFGDGPTFHVFMYLLFSANIKDNNYRGEQLKKGMLITGRNVIAKKTGLSAQNVRTALKHLELTNEITIKPTNNYSVITLTNWAKYQSKENNKLSNQPTIQPSANQVPTKYQPSTNQVLTNNQPSANHIHKKVKKDKNDNNSYSEQTSFEDKPVLTVINYDDPDECLKEMKCSDSWKQEMFRQITRGYKYKMKYEDLDVQMEIFISDCKVNQEQRSLGGYKKWFFNWLKSSLKEQKEKQERQTRYKQEKDNDNWVPMSRRPGAMRTA